MALEIVPLNDAALLLDINNAALPDIGELNIHKAQWLVDHCELPGLVRLDGRAAGIVVVLNDRCGYDSDFYRWFTDRYENFLYIDRIVVAHWARGQGVARQLYEAIDAAAQARSQAIAADVYCQPPNTPSLNLHHTMGFEEVGRQDFPAKHKIASKFMKYTERAKTKTV